MAQNSIFRGVARKIISTESYTAYRYHNTAVVRVDRDGTITLDSGGYRTATTKLAMNQVSNQFGYGFQVIQRKGDWFVVTDGGNEWEFYDGIVFTVAEARARAA